MKKQGKCNDHSFPLKSWGTCGSSVLDNFNWDKISHGLTNHKQSATLFEVKKIKRILNQILLKKLWYIGQIYTCSKFIKKEIEKAIAQLFICKCGQGDWDINTQLNSL